MRALLRSACEAWSQADHNPLLVLTAHCPCESPQGVWALYDAKLGGPLLHWAPPATYAEDGFTVAGRGEATRISVQGMDSFFAIRTAAESLFSEVIDYREDGCTEAPRPRLYGGFRFMPNASYERASSLTQPGELRTAQAEDPWKAFPDAGFALPRWSLLRRGDACYLQLAVRAARLRDLRPIESELCAIEQALASQAASAAASPHMPRFLNLQELSEERFYTLIDAALAAIAAGELVKVVAARKSLLEAECPFAPVAALRALAASYPECNRFAFEREEAVFLGATPELLALRKGRRLKTAALAGTKPRWPSEDDTQAKEFLLGNGKERREHAYVVAAILKTLQGLCSEAPEVGATTSRSLRNVHHLYTPISGTLRESAHILDLVAALHPTPAVCGLPRERAARFITTHEPASRGMYAAPVGWFDGQGDGAFWVAIRSALLVQNRAWLYAGAGVVAGSNPEQEYRETAAKQQAMLDALSGRS